VEPIKRIVIGAEVPVYGELSFRQATWHALLHPFLYVIDFKRALNFGEGRVAPSAGAGGCGF
jgi:hypothetical protein